MHQRHPQVLAVAEPLERWEACFVRNALTVLRHHHPTLPLDPEALTRFLYRESGEQQFVLACLDQIGH